MRSRINSSKSKADPRILPPPIVLQTINRDWEETYQYNMGKMTLLEQRIREKIQQVKDEMFPGHNRIYLESLKIEIDTLNWVLNEIISSNQDTAPKKRQR